MIPMTIRDFDWNYFCSTFYWLTWLDYTKFVCFALAWFFLLRKTSKSSETVGISGGFLFFTILGAILTIIHKLFFNLDATIIAYVLLLFVAFVEIFLCGRAQDRRQTTLRRSELLSRNESNTQSAGREHRSRRGRAHGDGSSSHHRRHSRRDSERYDAFESKGESVEPKFADSLKMDSVNE